MMRYKLLLSLYVGEGKAANLRTFAVRGHRVPLYTLEFQKEVHNVDWMNEIDESIPNIALGLKIQIIYFIKSLP